MQKPEEIRSVLFEDSYFPVIDGVVQVVHNYATIMNRQSYSCVVCPKSGAYFDDSTLPYDVFRMPSLSSAKWHYSVAVPGAMKGTDRIIEIAKPDILHVHSPFTQRTCALKLAKKLNLPLVTTFHTKYYDDIYMETKNKAITNTVIRNIINFYNQCDSVWACSPGAARTLHDYGYQGEIKVMPNGTNYKKPADPESVKKDTAGKFGIDPSKKNLIFVGTQVWQKNMRLVLDTMRVLNNRRNDIRLWVAGNGRDQADIKKYAEKLNLGFEQVSFLGKISDQKVLAGLFLNADILFFPSVYDTSSIVLREASVLGIPSLLTKGSNAADVVTPYENGFIAEENAEAMAARILEIIDNKELLCRNGENASRTIPIPWEELIPEVYEEYARVIEEFQKKKSRRNP